MTDKHIPASKLLALPKFITFMEEDGSTGFESFESGTWIRADDLRALIYAEPESVATESLVPANLKHILSELDTIIYCVDKNQRNRFSKVIREIKKIILMKEISPEILIILKDNHEPNRTA